MAFSVERDCSNLGTHLDTFEKGLTSSRTESFFISLINQAEE